MTGVRPNTNQVWHLGDEFRKINPDAVTMPQYFKKFGYRTINIGKIFHNYMPDSISWDEPDLRPAQYLRPEWLGRDGETFYVNEELSKKQAIVRDSLLKLRPIRYADGWNSGPAWEMEDVHDTMYYDGAQTELAIKTLRRLSKDKEPFYFALGYFRPHLPFAVPKKYWDLYDRDSIPLAPNPFIPKNSPIMSLNNMYELRHYDGFSHLVHPTVSTIGIDTARILKQGYYASVSYIDAQIGRLVQELKNIGLYENTILVIWGDHGWKLGEHNSWGKMSNYNIDIHTPLIILDPRQSENKGKQTFALTELVDIFPSLCELSGIDVPDYMEGTSFVPLMKDPDLEWKSAVFSQFHRRPNISPDGKRYMGYSIKTKNYHFIEWYHWDNETKQKGDYVTSELYNSTLDPEENDNVTSNPENKEIVDALSNQLKLGWQNAKPPLTNK